MVAGSCLALSGWAVAVSAVLRGRGSAAPPQPVIPRGKRGIQYAAASRFYHQRLWNTCMGCVKSRRYEAMWVISLFDGERHLLVPTWRQLAAWAERGSRVAAGHREAT